MKQQKGFLTFRALCLSVLLHCVAAILLFVSFEFEPKVITPPAAAPKKIIDAVTIDKKQLELELKKLQNDDEAAKQKEEKRQKELKQKAEAEKKKAKDAEQKRKAEEKKIALAKKQQEEEKKRIADLEKKKELEREKAKKAIEERKRLEAEKEAEKKKLEEQKKKAAEEKKKAEEEKRRKEKEDALQAELESELAAEQEQRDLTLIEKYVRAISGEIRDQFNTQALPEGLSCTIQIRMVEGGNVVEATVVKSSGNELFDRRARTAVYAASPLPVPDEARLFEKMQTIKIIFKP